jgi:hypothetical protein
VNSALIPPGFLLLFAVFLPVVVFGVVLLIGRLGLWSQESDRNRIRGIWFLSLSYFVIGLIQGSDGGIVKMALWVAPGIGWAVYAINLSRRR